MQAIRRPIAKHAGYRLAQPVIACVSTVSSSFSSLPRRILRDRPLCSRVTSPLVESASTISPSIRLFSSSTESDNAEPLEPREEMEYDVVIVGAGPAGLGAAIRLKQLATENNTELSVCIVEKGADVGAHILSGNVFIPTYLNELIPDWKEKGAPISTPVTHDNFLFLTETGAYPLPVPESIGNEGNYIISLGQLCRWLASEAESLGVEIYPGFAAAEILYDKAESAVNEHNPEGLTVVGIATGDVGIGKDGKKTPAYSRGMAIYGKQTLFAEGARGSCSEELINKFKLRQAKTELNTTTNKSTLGHGNKCEPQTYGIGLKEVWEIDPSKHKKGSVTHTIGWPAQDGTYQGTFMYHADNNQVYIGLVTGLDYENPYVSPYQEFQKFKTHPSVKAVLEGGKCLEYGARVINEGGFQSIPKVTFNGGMILGCSAGYVNVPKIKGSHNAMKSGMIAAEAIFATAKGLTTTPTDTNDSSSEITPETLSSLSHKEVDIYEDMMASSPIYKELYEVRNVRPAWKYGFLPFLANAGLNALALKGAEPWTLSHGHARDCDSTKPAAQYKPIDYPKPDGKLTFALLENLARSGVNHEEDQPSHLKIKKGKENVPLEVSLPTYAGPEGRFCPAGVYEYIEDTSKTQDANDGSGNTKGQEGPKMKLVINAQNCVHCKTCSIKTPDEFIQWTVPQGGGGPTYTNM